LLHAYSLVHDDLPAMDDAEMRRGRPACHRAFGEALAILAGDALQALAFAQLATPLAGVAPAAQLAAVAELARAAGAAGMCGGQALDMAAAIRPPDADGLRRLQALKTGALIRAAAAMGAILAGADGGRRDALAAYGQALGTAFQIADDVLDVVGEGSALGKSTGGDAAGGKVTVAGRYGVPAARALARSAADAALAALAGFDPGADPLRALVVFAVERDR
jgi:geranylgeranyl pyrophosphate synthase